MPDRTPEEMLEVLADHRRNMKRLIWLGLLAMFATMFAVGLTGYCAVTAHWMFARVINLAICCVNFSNLRGTLGRLIDTRRVLREIARVSELIELERMAKL